MAGTNLEFPNGNIEGAGGAGPLVVGALPRRFPSGWLPRSSVVPPPSASRRSSRAARPPFVCEACAELPVRNSRAQLRSQRSASASASSWVMFTGGARWTGGGTAELLLASRSAPAYLEPFLQKTIASLPRGIGRGDREGTTRQRSGGKTMRSCRSVPGSFLLGRERPGNAIFAVQNCIKTASSSPDAQIVGNGLFPKAKSNKS